MRIEDAIALRVPVDGTVDWIVPDGWQQGRGAWGGLVAGAMAGAVGAAEPDPDRRLRTLSIHLPGALLTGASTVVVEPIRLGSGMSTWELAIRQDGEVRAHAVAVTGRPRTREIAVEEAQWGTAQPPALPDWTTLQPLPTGLPGLPVFLQHVELRPASGLPFTSTPTRCTGYVRFREAGPWTIERLIAIVDAWYPSALPAMSALRPMATVTFAAHLLIDPETVPADQPLVYEGAMSGVQDGFTSEVRRLWTLDGRLAVENHQSIVVVA